MQIEGMIRSIGSSRCIGAVLRDGAHIVCSSEARIDGGLATCARICGVLDVALAGVVLLVGEASGCDCWTSCGGGRIGTCGERER